MVRHPHPPGGAHPSTLLRCPSALPPFRPPPRAAPTLPPTHAPETPAPETRAQTAPCGTRRSGARRSCGGDLTGPRPWAGRAGSPRSSASPCLPSPQSSLPCSRAAAWCTARTPVTRPLRPRQDGGTPARSGHTYEYRDKIFSLLQRSSHAYYHFLAETLPKLLLLQMDMDDPRGAPHGSLLLDASFDNSWSAELLRLLGFPRDRLLFRQPGKVTPPLSPTRQGHLSRRAPPRASRARRARRAAAAPGANRTRAAAGVSR